MLPVYNIIFRVRIFIFFNFFNFFNQFIYSPQLYRPAAIVTIIFARRSENKKITSRYNWPLSHNSFDQFYYMYTYIIRIKIYTVVRTITRVCRRFIK